VEWCERVREGEGGAHPMIPCDMGGERPCGDVGRSRRYGPQLDFLRECGGEGDRRWRGRVLRHPCDDVFLTRTHPPGSHPMTRHLELSVHPGAALLHGTLVVLVQLLDARPVLHLLLAVLLHALAMAFEQVASLGLPRRHLRARACAISIAPLATPQAMCPQHRVGAGTLCSALQPRALVGRGQRKGGCCGAASQRSRGGAEGRACA